MLKINKKVPHKNIKFLSKASFPQRNTVISVCRSALTKAPDKESFEILEYYLSSGLSVLSQQEINFIKTTAETLWPDYLIYRYKFNNYAKLGVIPDFPIYLLIEPTSICNLRCSMCFQTDRSFSSDKKYIGSMDIKLFKRIIDEAFLGGTKAITLASRGEPTLHPKLAEMLEYCAGKFLEIKINTNAICLTSELSHKILKNNVGIVVFSVDAYDADGYKKIRNSGKFAAVVKNILDFHAIRERYYPGSGVTTRAHGVKVLDDFSDSKFRSFWGNITDEVSLSDPILRWDTYNNPETNHSRACLRALDKLYIWYDGICNPCDVDYKSRLAMGNVSRSTIRRIWNGNKFHEFRKKQMGGRRAALSPCNRCEL